MNLAVSHHRPPAPADEVVVWLHGLQSDQAGEKAAYFRERTLAAGRAFASFDFRGHGKSGGALRDMTPTGLLEDAESVLLPLGSEYRRVLLIGSSMGGWVAAWQAVRRPGTVAGMVLIAPALRFPGTIADHVGPEAAERWRREGAITHDNGFGPATLSWALVEDGRRYPFEDLVARHATPTLILHGMKDGSCDWRVSADFAARAKEPRVEVLLFADGDHRLADRKERLADAAEAFWGRLVGSRVQGGSASAPGGDTP